jgi:hypothetical protein
MLVKVMVEPVELCVWLPKVTLQLVPLGRPVWVNVTV